MFYVMEPAASRSRLPQKPQSIGEHLEMVLMSRLVARGLTESVRGLVEKIVHHGLNESLVVGELEAVVGKDRALIHRALARHGLANPTNWFTVCRLLYVVYVHFRLRGPFKRAIQHLGLGTKGALSNSCKRVTGIRPSRAHCECLEANSILPFVDRCIPHLYGGTP